MVSPMDCQATLRKNNYLCDKKYFHSCSFTLKHCKSKNGTPCQQDDNWKWCFHYCLCPYKRVKRRDKNKLCPSVFHGWNTLIRSKNTSLLIYHKKWIATVVFLCIYPEHISCGCAYLNFKLVKFINLLLFLNY